MAGSEYSIVLLGRFAGKDRAVAQALSRSFGRDDAWGLQVVGATPIVLLSGLNIDQSSAIADALADVEQAGSRLEIQQGLDEGLPKIQWPGTPRIRGRAITEFGPGGVSAGGSHTMQLVVPCPYTNQKIQLTLQMSFGRAADGSVIPNVTATTAPYVPNTVNAPGNPGAMQSIPTPMPFPRPQTPAAPRHIISLPPPIPLPTNNPPQNIARLTPSSGLPQPQKIAPPPPVIDGLDALDELTPMDQIPTPTNNLVVPASKAARQSGQVVRPQTPPANAQPPLPLPQPFRPPGPPPPPPANMAKPLTVSFGVKQASAQAPLPDVPVLHTPKPITPPSPAAPSPLSNHGMPMPSTFSAPMDLSEFEANVTGSGLVAALQEEQQEPADSSLTGDDGALYSVFIGKTTNPKAHEITADVLGVSPAEAARMCQKPIVSLAKDVSLAKATDIKQRFASANIQVRLNKKR